MAAWTDADIADLYRLVADGLPYAEIANRLGRTYSAIACRAWRLGICRRTMPVRKPVGYCRRCRKRLVRYRGLCIGCYKYAQRHGKPRPNHLLRETCARCNAPKNGAGFVRGMCKTCYAYWLRNGIERPQHLIEQAAPHGWCECGQPAIKTVQLSVDTGTEVYRLCAECAQLEESYQPGDTTYHAPKRASQKF